MRPSLPGLLFGMVVLVAAGEARATRYSLWIHGRDQGTTPGNYNDWRAWGSSTVSAGVNKKSVNWDGKSSIASTNGGIRNALDCFCTGSNWCYIAAHSAGDLQIGYALANYGASQRSKKNATPNASGVCGNTDGTSMEATPRIKAHNVALKARAVKKAFMSAWDYSSSSLRIEATSSGESFRSFLSSNEATSLPGEPSKKVRSSFFSAVSRAFAGAMAGSYT